MSLRTRLRCMNPMWWLLPPFVVIVVVNVAMVVLAIDSFGGVTDPKAYEKGLAYNTTLAEHDAMARLGWHTGWTLTDHGNRSAEVVLTLADAAGAPLDGAAIRLAISRPVGEVHTATVVMQPDGAGRYRAAFSLPLAGQWQADITLSRGEDVYRASERFVLR